MRTYIIRTTRFYLLKSITTARAKEVNVWICFRSISQYKLCYMTTHCVCGQILFKKTKLHLVLKCQRPKVKESDTYNV